MEANLQADLAAIASNRETVIDDIVAMWPTESGGEEDLRSALSLADDEDLLAILNAGSFNEVIPTLGGGDLLEVRTDRDYVFTPVTPCRIAETRVAGPGIIVAGTGRIWRVYGTGAQMIAQGGSPMSCPSLRGEPRGVLINMIAVNPLGKGNLQASPIGASEGLSVNFNSANMSTWRTPALSRLLIYMPLVPICRSLPNLRVYTPSSRFWVIFMKLTGRTFLLQIPRGQ